jgi:hypothetical protein
MRNRRKLGHLAPFSLKFEDEFFFLFRFFFNNYEILHDVMIHYLQHADLEVVSTKNGSLKYICCCSSYSKVSEVKMDE